jgi:hypothetical protein
MKLNKLTTNQVARASGVRGQRAKMINHFDEKQAIQALKDEMTRRWRTGGEPRQEYQLTETEIKMIDAGLAHLRELIKNGVGE